MPPKKTAIDEKKSNRPPTIGKTIKVRATQRGQYGFPTANLVEADTVFAMAVKDLEKHDDVIASINALTDDNRREARKTLIKSRTVVVHDGTKYLLPSWVEDASTTPATIEPDEDEPEQTSDSENVI